MKTTIPSPRNKSAFSMIEVSLALAIVGVAMVSILGLFVVGVDAVRDGTDDNMASQIIQAVINDRRSTPYDFATPALSDTSFAIPSPDTGTFPYALYFKKAGGTPLAVTGATVGGQQSAYYYEVDIRPNPASATLNGIAFLDFKVSWPTALHMTNRTASFYTTAISKH